MKKIVIRLPNWLGDIMMSFPFMYALKQEFPLDEIYVIVKPQYEEVVKLLPFPVKIHLYDKKEHGSLPHEIHKYCVNEKFIFNVDLYFCLPPSFSSAFMGYCFRAKEVVGYKGEWRSFFLKHKFERPIGKHRSEEYMDLLRNYLKKEIVTPKLISMEVPPYFEDQELKYLVINVNSEASSRRLPKEKWLQLIELFDQQTFVFIGIDKDQERVKEVIDLLPKDKNQFINLCGKTQIKDLVRLFAHSSGIVTNDSGPAHLAAFVGTSVVVFFGAGDEKNTAPNYFKAPNLIVKKQLSCSPCLKNQCPIKTLDCLNQLDMGDTLDQIHNFLYLK